MIFDEPSDSGDDDPEDQLDFDALERASELEKGAPEGPEPPKAPEPPKPPEPPSAEEAPPELQRMFWSVVVVVNAAVLAVSLGLMFVVFRGRLRLGGGLVLVGLVAFGHAYSIYRRSDYS